MLRWLKSANPAAKFPEPKPGLPSPNTQPTPALASQCAAANAAIESSVELYASPQPGSRKRKRGAYSDYTDEQRLKVARYAAEHTATKAARKFTEENGQPLNESTVRGWVKKYKSR